MEKSLIRVLLVEDDEDDYIITQELLSDIIMADYHLDWVSSYQDAMDLIDKGVHDVYLIDYRLGHQSGLELAKEALVKGCKAPIILLTGQGGIDVDLEAMESGIADFLVKGKIDSQLLERTIRYNIERNREKEDLQKSEDNLKRAQEVAKIGSWIWNTSTNEMEMSDELYNLLGFNRDDDLPELDTAGKLVHPDDREMLTEAITKAIQEKTPYSLDYRIFRMDDGELRHLHVETEIEKKSGSENVVIYGTVQDITERINVDTALKESEFKYKNLVESSPDGIITISKTGTLLSVNESFAKLTGFDKSDFVGKPFLKAPTLVPQELSVYSRMLKDVLSNKIQGSFEFNWRHANGEIRNGEARASLLRENNKIVGVQAIVRDITERRNAEETLNRRLDELHILQEVSSICLENIDENETISKVSEVIGKKLFPDHFGVMLLDEEEKMLRIHPSYQGISRDDYNIVIKIGEGVTGQVARDNKPVRIDDVSKVKNYFAPSLQHASELCVPISVNGKVYGVINAESAMKNAFTSEDDRLMNTVADQLAVALQKSRLYQEEKIRRIEAETQREASKLLTMSLDLDEVLNTILDNLTKVIEFDQASVHLFERDQIRVVAGHGFNDLEPVVGYTYSFDNQIAIDIVESKSPLVLEDASVDDRFDDFGFVNIRGWMGIPLIEKGAVIGILTVDSSTPGVYTQDQSELIQVYANNAAGAIVKARLFEEEKKRRLEAEIQQKISLIVTQTLDLHTILESILLNLQRYLEFDSAGILLEENGNLRIVATHGFDQPDLLNNHLIPKTHKLYQEILMKESVVIIGNVEEDDRFEDFGAEVEIRGWMGVPLIDQGKVIGYISFDSKTPGKFTNEMGQLAQVLVNLTSSAITKAQLFDKTQLGLKRLEALHEIDRIITSSVELSFAIKQILNIIVSQLEIDTAAVIKYEPNSQTFMPVDSVGLKPNFNSKGIFGNGYASKVALERKVLRIEDKSELKSHFGNNPDLIREDFSAYVGVPLIAKGEIKGVLEIFHRSPLNTNNEWDGFLQTLATQLAIAIDNSQMFENLQKSHLELTMSYDSTIEGWAQALELRDMETEGHSRRVVDQTLDLAKMMGVDGQELAHIRRGALLHDIGKMAVPDAILQKSGELSDEEWEIMRQHPTYAMEWLSSTDYLKPALNIPYCHHEKWDGTGYPQGLMGEEIPLPARIFSIIDVYDALRSDRPYRKAWSKEKTLTYIQDESGKHFDPKVVDAFLEMMKGKPSGLEKLN